jgi:hypothetical protein
MMKIIRIGEGYEVSNVRVTGWAPDGSDTEYTTSGGWIPLGQDDDEEVEELTTAVYGGGKLYRRVDGSVFAARII